MNLLTRDDQKDDQRFEGVGAEQQLPSCWTKGTGVLGGRQLMKDRATASLEGFIVIWASQTPAK